MDKQTNPTASIRLGEIACYSEIGQKANQEDSIFPAIGEATASQRVFLVCDGMGGAAGGQVASTVAVETYQRGMRLTWPGIPRTRLAMRSACQSLSLTPSIMAYSKLMRRPVRRK